MLIVPIGTLLLSTFLFDVGWPELHLIVKSEATLVFQSHILLLV